MKSTTSSVSSHAFMFDALPYYDGEIDRIGMLAKVKKELATVASEARDVADQGSKDCLHTEKPLFHLRPDLQAMYERVVSSGERDGGLDLDRYRLLAPEAEDRWIEALRNGETQLMHLDARYTNLELLKKFGANHWRLHNFQLETELRHLTIAADEVQDRTRTLNRQRKLMHTEAGKELTRLNRRWAEWLNQSLHVELANMVAQSEIESAEERVTALRRQLDRERNE